MAIDPAIGIAGAIDGLDANRVYPGVVYVTPDGSGSLQEPPPADVEYQINEDGRRRAIVRTYQAGTTGAGIPSSAASPTLSTLRARATNTPTPSAWCGPDWSSSSALASPPG